MKEQEKSIKYKEYVISTYFDTLRQAFAYMIVVNRNGKEMPFRGASGFNSNENAEKKAIEFIDSHNQESKVSEETVFKPTLKQPINNFSKANDNNYKKEMSKSGIKLNETDELLTEKEQSLKKKIFSLAKMEALVFADPKLSVVYNDMAENGEEKYGYHYNETIMNMIFNDYILNSPKYIQKYKMAIPKKKKRRDKSGINQLKKSGEEIMHKSEMPQQPQENPIQTIETTGASSSGAFAPPMGFKKSVEETTTSASSGAYAGPAAWGDGDLMKGKASPVMSKPIWKGGSVIQESNYLTDPSGFKKYAESLNEDIDIHGNGRLESPVSSQQPNVKPYTNPSVNNKIIDKTAAFTSNTVKKWGKPDTELELNTINSGKMDTPNLKTEGTMNDNMITTIDQLRQLKANGQKLTKEIIPRLAGEALHKMAIQIANKILPMNWDDLPDINSMWDYIDENGGMSLEELYSAAKEAANERMSEVDMDGMSGMFDENQIQEKSKSIAQQQAAGMAFAAKKGNIPMSKLSGASKEMTKMGVKDLEDYAGTKHNGLPQHVDENILNELSLHDTVEYISDRNGEDPFTINDVKWQFVNAKYPDGKIDIGVYRYGHDLVYDYNKWKEAMNINETDQSMIGDSTSGTMALKPQPTGTISGGGVVGGLTDMKENYNFLDEINNELNAYSIHHTKLMKMVEDKKPSSLILKDRLGLENSNNFKKDLQHSGTKEIIDVEKELMYKDQQSEVGDDPQKLGQEIEDKALKVSNGGAFKNVGDSTNNKGDEIPKRNLTKPEQDEVNNYRLGQHSLVYDNKTSERYEDRMKKDMGDDVYDIRKKQLDFRSKAPMYNKDTQPTEVAPVRKVQFDKEKTGWNEREGLSECMVTGRYRDFLNKSHIIDFTLNEVKILKGTARQTGLFKLDFTGLGNSYNGKTVDNKVSVNESVVSAINTNKFYTDGKIVYSITNTVNLNENDTKVKPVINEQFDKMKHLLNYKPNNFVSTSNIKKNRGF